MERLWWLNDESQQILNRGYLLKGETVTTAIERVANAAAKRLYKPELAEAFIEMIEKNDLQIILETHSDHILNRIRRRVAQAKIEENDSSLFQKCAILFAEREKGGVKRWE